MSQEFDVEAFLNNMSIKNVLRILSENDGSLPDIEFDWNSGSVEQKITETIQSLLLIHLKSTQIEQIKIAFATVEYPGDRDITSSTYGEEPEALQRDFIGKTDWRSIDYKFLDRAPEGWHSALSFFSDRAFHFYLPAYLIADIQGELKEVFPEFHLCYGINTGYKNVKIAKIWGGGTVASHARQRFDHFSTEQAAVIVDYLQWKPNISEDQEIIEALENYWLVRIRQ
jgi:hypothetical protein